MGQQRPDDSSILVGQRKRRDILVASLHYCVEPAARVCRLSRAIDDRSSTVYQQGAQVAVATLAHAQQVRLAPRRVLPGHQSQQSSQLAAAVEVLRIPDGRDQRARRDGADAGHLSAPADEVAASMPCVDLLFELFNLALKFLEVVERSLDEYAEGSGELGIGVFDQFWHPRSDMANASRNDEAKLTEQAANLIGLRRTRLHEALANPAKRQHRLLQQKARRRRK